MGLIDNNIFDQLKTEHNKVKSLLKKCETAKGSERKDLLDKIELHLVPHSRGEEKSLYATLYQTLADESDDSTLVNEAYEEHSLVDNLLDDLKQMDIDDEKWMAKLEVMKENINHHIEEEEEELFSLAKEVLDSEQLDEIHAQYISLKEHYEETLPTQSQIDEREQSAPLKRALG